MNFSLLRLLAIIHKEFIQIRRDRGTFAMILGIPLMQMILFGYAINTDPKYLPTAIISADQSPLTRTFIQGLKNTDYFSLTQSPKTEAQAEEMMRTGTIQFILTIPADFSRKLVRGEHPSLLLEGDATDPIATQNALSAASTLANKVFDSQLEGSLSFIQPSPPPVNLKIHPLYNPDAKSTNNIIPGLIGTVLTLTLVSITGISITRERERGTMENLLSTPIQPLELMLGKLIPYVVIGYFQISLIMLGALGLFSIHPVGSLVLLFLASLPFIAANLSVGLLFSTLAKNQLQATQLTTFFFLPSILLSGFIFPFRGMPGWAQSLGETLPLTHYLRITRSILLKGSNFFEIFRELWPIIIFVIFVLTLASKRFHKKLD